VKIIEYIVYISARVSANCTYVKLVYITDQFYPRNLANLYRSRRLTHFHSSFLVVIEIIVKIHIRSKFFMCLPCDVNESFLAIGWLIL